MHAYFTNTGKIRLGLSKRNIEYILGVHEGLGSPDQPVGALDSPDVYVDDIMTPQSRFVAAVGSIGESVVQINGQDVLVAYDRDWLDRALESLENNPDHVFETHVRNGITIYADSDESHYAHRKSWMEDGEQPKFPDESE